MTTTHPTRRSSIASWSQSIPRPGTSEATACPSMTDISDRVIARSCGMCSTYRPLGTAAVKLTCSSIKKYGHTSKLNVSARCATFSHGVMPPIRATSTWTIPAPPAATYSRNCETEYSDSPTAIGIDVDSANRTWPVTSSAGRGSSNHDRSTASNAAARRFASAYVIDWFASTMMSIDGPTASRTARSRSRSSCTRGLPTLSFTPGQPAFCDASAPATSSSVVRCNQPPSVSYSGTRCRYPPANRHNGSPARRHRRSHSAVSTAANASDVIAPTVVACVDQNRSDHSSSTLRASLPTSRGSRWSRSSASTAVPPVPIVYEYPRPLSPSDVDKETKIVSCLRNACTASVRTVS